MLYDYLRLTSELALNNKKTYYKFKKHTIILE